MITMSAGRPGCRIKQLCMYTLNTTPNDTKVGTTRVYVSIMMIILSGGGKRPETWANVVECLKTVELYYLADSVEKLFEDKLPQPPLTPQQNNAG